MRTGWLGRVLFAFTILGGFCVWLSELLTDDQILSSISKIFEISNNWSKHETFTGRLIENSQLTASTNHLRIALAKKMTIKEGQSVGVVVSDTHRLYSVANQVLHSRIRSQVIDLCVKRLKNGVGSNYLCDSYIGSEIKMFGPIGNELVLPEQFDKDIILIATGTGIAPFRGILQKFVKSNYNGKIKLFFGCRNKNDFLFEDEIREMSNTIKLEIHVAYSSEGLYVQELIKSETSNIKILIDRGSLIMICGGKDMGRDVKKLLADVLGKTLLKELKKSKRLRAELY